VSDISTRIENMDAELHLEASGQGLESIGDFHLVAQGEWREVQCYD
jgi:hypothetical protein